MKKRKIFLLSIGITAFLLIASIAFGISNMRSPYNFHTGLGSGISVSPDDSTLAFSYFFEGKESIYTGNLKTGQVKKMTESGEQDYRFPQFSPNGKDLLYLAADSNGIQSIHYLKDGAAIRLTDSDMHVSTATFSPDGTTIYFAGMPADDFLKSEEEKRNGTDLYSVELNGNTEQLTDKDAFSMHGLSVSSDGKTLFYSSDDDQQAIHAYDLEIDSENLYSPEFFKSIIYDPAFSPDGKFLAYTAAENTAANETYKYELYLLETVTGKTEKLTNFNASVTSPSFFHRENRIAFLVQPNWPDEPQSFKAMTVDFEGHESPIDFSLPEPAFHFQLADLTNRFVTISTLAALYLLLFGLLSVYFHSASRKIYFPAKLSAGLTVIVFLGSLVATAVDIWATIGLFMLGIGLAACTLAVFAFSFVYLRISGRTV